MCIHYTESTCLLLQTNNKYDELLTTQQHNTLDTERTPSAHKPRSINYTISERLAKALHRNTEMKTTLLSLVGTQGSFYVFRERKVNFFIRFFLSSLNELIDDVIL
uniref:Uncharacterized protein n=1 Tax=Cacopsylla melanoneura TaxID=428564 RepID=A0A8D9F8Q8_9HEMI